MIRLLAGLSALVLAFGALGGLAAPLDSLALARVPAALVLLVSAIGLAPKVRWAAWIFAVAMLGTWGLGLRADASGGELLLYQKNVFFINQAPQSLVADIEASGADLVTLQELSQRTRVIKDALLASYPYAHACMFRGWEVAVLSRHPFTDAAPRCSRGRGLAAAEVQTPAGPVWVASVHNPWPWPHGGWDRGRELADLVAGLGGPVVVAGDFNTVPWSATVRRMARAAGGEVLGPARGSLRVDPVRLLRGNDMTGAFDPALGPLAVPIAIDHVIAPGGQRSLRPLLGSDHHGLLARIALPRRAE